MAALKLFGEVLRILEKVCLENFDFLLSTGSQRLLKQTKKYKQAISHAERLPVTIT